MNINTYSITLDSNFNVLAPRLGFLCPNQNFNVIGSISEGTGSTTRSLWMIKPRNPEDEIEHENEHHEEEDPSPEAVGI
jgi:hypothetical protein